MTDIITAAINVLRTVPQSSYVTVRPNRKYAETQGYYYEK